MNGYNEFEQEWLESNVLNARDAVHILMAHKVKSGIDQARILDYASDGTGKFYYMRILESLPIRKHSVRMAKTLGSLKA